MLTYSSSRRLLSFLLISVSLIEMLFVEGFLIMVNPQIITKFKQNQTMDDHFCTADITNSGSDVPSLGTCVQLCKSSGDSLIYNDLTNNCQCYGKSDVSSLACKLESSSGNRFYYKDDVSYVSPATEAPPEVFFMVGPPLVYNVPVTFPTTPTPDGWLFRLVNGTSTSGRLEINRNGTWGVVYGFSVTVADATIICRDILKISTYGFPIYGDYFGEGEVKDGLSKDYDTEDQLLCGSDGICSDYMWKSEGDTDFADFAEFGTVGLDCTDNDLQVQLAGGDKSTEGRLEVMLLGTWGTVCGDADWEDGPLYCRYLGLNYTYFALAGNEEQASRPVWIHGGLYNCDVENATSPADCDWSPYTKTHFSSNCSHSADVILYC